MHLPLESVCVEKLGIAGDQVRNSIVDCRTGGIGKKFQYVEPSELLNILVKGGAGS